ncbi:hypothetical protein D1224_05085 [Henriciella barbarensis]|uniref:Uncharacterized protein n=1 Tax=Henriciella barbarensis TaxID=86342 RepID=A0A399R189_9PROT|nr:hypothetical protein [Henriciella barbarensis]RIJ23637.1 hypothetical protein D1224_05085 [Henriciella barbarensis]
MFRRCILCLTTGVWLAVWLAACATSPTAPAASAAEKAARDLVARLGAQQAFAMLGWQQNADYKPSEACFEAWRATPVLTAPERPDCDAHAEDLARLYASYGQAVEPVVFKSQAYWAAWEAFSLTYPGLVADWEAAGGSEDDASFLTHPVCAAPLQTGWDGSAYFYDGAEHPLCRLYKIDPVAAAQ